MRNSSPNSNFVYLVCEVNWDTSDEGWYPTDSVEPLYYVTTEEEAQRFVEELTINNLDYDMHLNSIAVWEYLDDYTVQELKEKFGEDICLREREINDEAYKKLDNDSKRKLLKILEINLYEYRKLVENA